MALTVRSAGMCCFNHTLALHRPINGAMAIMLNAIPIAIRINVSFLPKGFAPKGEPAVHILQQCR
jgi:hypothetical protein